MNLLTPPALVGLDPGPTAALGAATIWAFTSILFTAAGRDVVPTATNLFKTAAATLLFAVALYLRDGLPWPADLGARQAGLLLLSGVIGLGIGDSFLFAAFQVLGTRRGMLVQSTHPILGTLLAVLLFHELPTFAQFVGISVVLLGVGLVLGEGHRSRLLDPAHRRRGIVFGLIAALGQAVGAMLAKEALFEVEAFGATQLRVLGGALSLLVYAVVRGELRGWIRGLAQPRVLWRVSAASVLGPFLGVFLMLYSLQNAPAGVALTLLATSPVLLLPLGAIFQKDHPTRQEAIGVVVALAGVAVLVR